MDNHRVPAIRKLPNGLVYEGQTSFLCLRKILGNKRLRKTVCACYESHLLVVGRFGDRDWARRRHKITTYLISSRLLLPLRICSILAVTNTEAITSSRPGFE